MIKRKRQMAKKLLSSFFLLLITDFLTTLSVNKILNQLAL